MRRYSVSILIFSVASLIALGLVMLFSTGAFARDSHGDMYYFIQRQAIWLGIGLIACAVAAWVNHSIWRRTWWLWFGGSIILLALCFVPGIGMKLNGSYRWLNLGVASFQPSEVAKFAIILFLAWYYEKPERDASNFWRGIVLPWLVISIPLALIVCEVDLGTTALLIGTALSVMFVAGMAWWWLIILFGLGGGGIIFIATQVPERMARLTAFLDPEKYSLTEGHQQLQALIAFGSGGIEGLGLGQGRQKMFYLPYSHTDFIFPMVGEELGLRVTLLTVLCYLLIAISGAMIAMNARDRFSMFLSFGAMMLLCLQAAVNIGVTTSLLPNKGMPLPFISYGGSNLLLCLFLVGILISVHRHGRPLTVPVARFAMAARLSTRVRR